VDLVSDLDLCAARLVDDSDQTYEVAILVAQAADRYAAGSSPVAVAAATIRDVFATWVKRIHAPADAVHGEKTYPPSRNRWAAHVGTMDTTWLQEARTPLVRSSRFRHLIKRLRAISP
jgi:hypothetical protein